MKKILGVALLLVIALVIFQWHEKRERELEAQGFTLQIKAATRDVAEQLNLFREARGVTYAEAIAVANDRIAQLEQQRRTHAAASNVRDKVAAESVGQYLSLAQAAIRWSRAMVLARAESVAAKNTMQEAVADLEAFAANPTSQQDKFRADVASYGANPAIRRSHKAVADAEAAADALGKSLSEMLAMKEKRPKLIPGEAYLQPDQVKDISMRLD